MNIPRTHTCVNQALTYTTSHPRNLAAGPSKVTLCFVRLCMHIMYIQLHVRHECASHVYHPFIISFVCSRYHISAIYQPFRRSAKRQHSPRTRAALALRLALAVIVGGTHFRCGAPFAAGHFQSGSEIVCVSVCLLCVGKRQLWLNESGAISCSCGNNVVAINMVFRM